MDLTKLVKSLGKAGCLAEEQDRVITYLQANVRSFLYANEPVTNLEVYVVLRHVGGVRLFKTVRGSIIMDKLDSSYSESRELVCLSSWNVKAVYQLTFSDAATVICTEINTKSMHSILFDLVQPQSIKYVAGVEEQGTPATILVDCEDAKGMSYTDFLSYMQSSYKHMVKGQGRTSLSQEGPTFYAVGYQAN